MHCERGPGDGEWRCHVQGTKPIPPRKPPAAWQHNSELGGIYVYTNCFFIGGLSRIITDNTKSFCQPSFKPPVSWPYKNLLSPELSLHVHMSL